MWQLKLIILITVVLYLQIKLFSFRGQDNKIDNESHVSTKVEAGRNSQ